MSAAAFPRWRFAQALRAVLEQWRRRWQERAELARLSDRELRDFLISRSEAMEEAAKPFWRE
jgi:uncharacterized protein YjiS (DUF1127 family)